MLRTTFERLLISGTTLGAMLAAAFPAVGCDQADNAFATGSLVQAYGTAPPGNAPAQPMPAPGMQGQGMAGQGMPAQGMMAQGPPIQILNDPSSGGEVWFLVDGQEKGLKAGETLDLTPGQPHLVEFNTAGSQGDTKFTLYQGLYKFKVTQEGWGLFKSSSPPSMTGQHAAQAGGPPMDRRGHLPPLPAHDLRTRRVARGATTGTADGQRVVDPQAKPADTVGGGRDATHSISAPTPPAPGVVRERTPATPAPAP